MTAHDQELVLHPLLPSQAPLAAALYARTVARPWSLQSWSSLLSDPTVFGFAALPTEMDTPVIGVALARAIVDEAEILALAVAPEARRLGIGSALVKAAWDEAASRGAKRVFLEVAADNEPAIQLYRGLGFVDAGRRRGYYGACQAGDALILAYGAVVDPAPHRS